MGVRLTLRRQVYDICSPGYRGRCTAPLLVDRRARRIVSNESAGIVRNLNAVSLPACTDVDLVPPSLAAEIDALNEQIYDKVPTAGFAKLHGKYGGRTSGSFATRCSTATTTSRAFSTACFGATCLEVCIDLCGALLHHRLVT
jgi:glutathionyl-hydroquinone reductase